MSTDLGNIGFIVWRECVEALLIIGILNAWITQRSAQERRRARVYLWSGVAVGIAVAAALAAILVTLGGWVSGTAHQAFQTGMEAAAAALILQMVFWMRKHGKSLRSDLMSNLSTSAASDHWWGVFGLALLAVAREGSEAVVFLYGTLFGHDGAMLRILAAAVGLGAAVATFALMQVGRRALPWRIFFQISGFMLLCLAGALIVTVVDNLQALDLLPELSGRLWDSSRLLSDSGSIGGLVAALTGYRARPELTQILVLAGYWLVIYLAFFRNPASVRSV